MVQLSAHKGVVQEDILGYVRGSCPVPGRAFPSNDNGANKHDYLYLLSARIPFTRNGSIPTLYQAGLLAKGDLIMSRARKGVISEGKCATPQEHAGSGSSSELLAKIVAMMEE